MEANLVSVVIPTRNRADFLRPAIASVLSQTYANLEIIVVDDASTDDTPAVVRAMNDGRIRFLSHRRSRGAAAARNKGVRTVRGEIIGFLDDDDEWVPGKVEAQIELLRLYDAVICASDTSDGPDRLADKRTIELSDLRRGKFTSGGTSVLMAKTELLRAVPFDESLPRYQDWDLFIRIACRTPIAYLNKPLVRYNEGQHARITNSIRAYGIEELEHQFRMLRKHREFFGTRGFRRHMSRALLYGIGRRPDRWKLLAYVVRRYGPLCALAALYGRLRSAARARVHWRDVIAGARGRAA